MVKLYGVLMAVSILLLLLACAPPAAPVAATAPAAPQVASPLPAPVAPAISAEEAAWQKVVAAAKKEGTLTIYSGGGLLGDTALALTKTFRDRTGLVVENIYGQHAVHIERIKAERRAGTPVASLMTGDLVQLIGAKGGGLLQHMGYLPSLAEEAAWSKSPLYDGEDYIITSSLGIQGPWINTKLVNPQPRSWRDLLQPQWKGKIDAPDPVITIHLARLFYYLTKYGGLDEAYFRQVGTQMTWSLNARMGIEKMVRGEAHMVPFQSSSAMGPFVQAGAPVKAIDMEEGVVGLVLEPYSLLDGASHPNAARLFANFALSQEGQTLFHKSIGSRSLRKDVPDFTPLAGQLSPKRVILTTTEGEGEVSKLFLDGRLAKLMKGP